MKGVVLRVVFLATTYLGYLFMGYGVDRSNFWEVSFGYLFLFVAMIMFYRNRKELSWRDLFLTAMLFRAVFLFSEPRLSDDYYRFIWDGRITAYGENPYLVYPETYVLSDEAVALGLTDALYEGMNSKKYYTVYPPLNQAMFAFCSRMGRGDPTSELFFYHLLIFFSELLFLSIMGKLLRRFSIPHTAAIWYALNPLVIVELCGNLHFEGVVVTLLGLAVWLYVQKSKWWWISAICFGAAVSVKLLPLMLLPLVGAFLKWKSIRYYAVVAATFLVGFVPFFSEELIRHWQSSIGLYFRTFEFNASLYYVVREIGQAIYGYNPIQTVGPVMSIITITAILVVATLTLKKYAYKVPSISVAAKSVQWTYLIYFFMATTVHPWYIITIAAVTVFVKRKEALLWSFLVLLSYSHYHGGGFSENYLFISLEYGMLLLSFLIPKRWSEELEVRILNESP